MFARNFLNSIRNNSLMITRSQLKSQIPFRFLSSETVIRHNPDKRIFYLDVDGKTAYIKYTLRGKVMRLLTTQVPKELEGRGLGKLLAHAAFTYVAENDLKMVILCNFLKHYLDKYAPEFKKYVEDK